jgi:hypothetical protein
MENPIYVWESEGNTSHKVPIQRSETFAQFKYLIQYLK